jgi:phosphate transport system substrate-binding protein
LCGLIRPRAEQRRPFRGANAVSFQVAAASADWTADRDFHLVLTNAPGEDAYPITATTFVVMPKQPKSPERSTAAFDFMRWSLESGKTQAETLNYVPLPPNLVEQVEMYWQQNLGPATVTASASVKR